MKNLAKYFVGMAIVASSSCQEVRKVEITVTEESGAPIENADVRVYYLARNPDRDKEVAGVTDGAGKFVARSAVILRMEVSIQKDGYYATRSGRLSHTQDHELTCVLRKVKNPVPLYAKKFRGKLPNLRNKHGFDFEVGDWVAPYGEGKIVDIFMAASIVGAGNQKPSGSIEITFPRENEGGFVMNEQTGYMPESALVMPHLAPSHDYVRIIARDESGYENKSKPRNESYYFRTRSMEMRQGGRVFNYSKFLDGFSFVMGGGVFLEEPYRQKYPEEYGLVEFTYCFNPTPNDRNLEFDPKRNLFTDLESTEQVHDP